MKNINENVSDEFCVGTKKLVGQKLLMIASGDQIERHVFMSNAMSKIGFSCDHQ